MHDTIFREYDIRGIVGTQLIIDQVYRLGRAIAYYLKQQKPTLHTIAVGMDGRTHSPLIKEQLCMALQDSGIEVVFLGVCPTPVLYFAQHILPFDAGIMITASHNPPSYNGIKIMLDKHKVWGAQLQQIKKLYQTGASVHSMHKGNYSEQDIIDLYVAWLKEQFIDLIGYPPPMVLDCGNGATGAVVPRLLQAMQWQSVPVLCQDIDGSYPNHEADPTIEHNVRDIQLHLSQHPALSLGIGFDGDGDRMGVVLANGLLVPGDVLLAVFARSIAATYPHRTVVFDVKASSNTQAFVASNGMSVSSSPSGHAHIKSCMSVHNAILGGELSCHFFFLDRYFGFDDGLYAMLRLVEIVKQNPRAIEDVIALLPPLISTPEIRIPCAEEVKRNVVLHIQTILSKRTDAVLTLIDGVRAALPYGTGLVRASNTQPAICLRFEAANEQNLRRIKHDFAQLLKDFIDEKQLSDYFAG